MIRQLNRLQTHENGVQSSNIIKAFQKIMFAPPVDPRRAALVKALHAEFGAQEGWNGKLDRILSALDSK